MKKVVSQISEFIKSHIRTAFIANSAWIVFEQIYKMSLNLVIGVLTARYLGPNNMGIITYAATYVNAFIPFATLSMEYVVIKDIVEKPKKSGEIIGSGIFLRIIASLISVIIILGIVSSMKFGDKTYIIVTLLTSLSLIAGSLTLVDSWLQAQLRSKYATIIKSISYTMMSAYRIYILATGKNVIWFAFSVSLDAIVTALFYGYFIVIKSNIKIKISKESMRHLLTQSVPFIFSSFMIVIYGQLDRIFLDYYHGEEALGLYGVGSNLSYLWQIVPVAIITSARPVIINAKNNSHELYLKRMRQLYAFIWWLSVIVALFFTIFGDFIVRILYEEEFSSAAIILKIVSWSQGFSLLGGARAIWLLAENKNKYYVVCQLCSAFFSVLMNILLIPHYGAVGAAISTVIIQAFVALFSTMIMKQTRESTSIMMSGIFLRNIR